MTLILGIDPGKRTGVALLEVTDDSTPVLIAYEEVYGGAEGFSQWWETHPKYDVLVVENYIPRGGAPQNQAKHPLGVIGFLAQYGPILQTPAGRLQGASDAVLKRLGLYLPGERLRNVREAVRHVVWYLKRQGHMPTLRVGWPNV